MEVTRTYTEDNKSFGEIMLQILQEQVNLYCMNKIDTVQLELNKENI